MRSLPLFFLFLFFLNIEFLLAQGIDSLVFTEPTAVTGTDVFDNFERNSAQIMADYEKNAAKLLENFKAEVEKLWGNYLESTTKTWVQYRANKTALTAVDFEKGTAKISIIVTEEEAKDEKIIQQKMGEALKDLILDKGLTDETGENIENQHNKIPVSPILKDQIINKSSEPIDETNVDIFIEETITETAIDKKTITGGDNKKRVKCNLELPLAPNHIEIRAKQYYEQITVYATTYMLDNELILAIIHIESFFNPKAKSKTPAYGLMQIVPKWAGRAAYKHVYNSDITPSPGYLYVAEQNIELGCAYFDIFLTKTFAKVKNENNRMLCAIAAYNTGAGNVAKAFTGNKNIDEAIPKINLLSESELYSYFKNNLPYKGTRTYIDLVFKYKQKYKEWQKK